MVRERAVVAGMVSVLLAPVAMAESGARDYLDRMSRSFRELNYHGVFTYEHGSQIESLRITHAVRDGVERERLVYLTGEPREIVRDGHLVSCSHAGNEIMRLGGRLLQPPFAGGATSRADISDYYLLALGAQERVAGRPVVELLVRPVDEYRYGFHLYLDADTALLLKGLTVSPSGAVLERFQFADVEIGAGVDDSQLQWGQEPVRHPHHYVIEQSAAVDGREIEWPSPQWLPPGFTLSARSVGAMGQRLPRMIMYSDGFATMTLVLEAIDAGVELAADGKASHGATVAYLRQLRLGGQPFMLTVVGEVPLETARRVARSVVIQREPS